MAKTPNTAAAKRAEASAGKALKVTARRESFWRGGLQFTGDPRIVPLDTITAEQEERIRAEGQPGGMLVVEEVDLPAGQAA